VWGGTGKRDYRNKIHNSAGLPEPILRPLPTTGYGAEILGVSDSYLGYDVEKFPSQQPQQKMRSTSRAGPLGGYRETYPSTQAFSTRSN
jgi:hypothetical protein